MRLLSALLMASLTIHAFAHDQIKVATFDSGFGGYFTAKEIEKQSMDLSRTHEANFSISHYGDTVNAPYGEKTPEMIAKYSAAGISKAFDDGAEVVFIACNTASTQYEAIKQILNQKHPGRGSQIVSIIDSSVTELKKLIDEKFLTKKIVNVAILATPATIRAGAYLRAVSAAYKVKDFPADLKVLTQERWYKLKGEKIDSVFALSILKLEGGKEIRISQIGPANWVDMIEHGASTKIKAEAIERDLSLLAPVSGWDVVGEFCTHYPAVDDLIKKHLANPTTSFIKQGPLMADIYRKMMLAKLVAKKTPTVSQDVRARIFISGQNVQETADLARDIFPTDPRPRIDQKNFD